MSRREDAQLGLFDAAPPATTPVPADLVALGARLARLPLYLGTSSWAFPGWAGHVYPPGVDGRVLPARGLGWYGAPPLLRAVGVDRSYYAPLTAADWRAFAAQVPADFRFLAKAERVLTTPPGQLPPGLPVPTGAYLDGGRLHATGIEPLLAGLGPDRGGLILQFPPLAARERADPAAFARRLAGLLGRVPPGLEVFVEVRNASVLTPDYFAVLAASGAWHCYSVHPGAAPLADQARLAAAAGLAGPALVRWNLRRDRAYASAREEFAPFNRLVAPDPDTRAEVVAIVAAALAAGRRAHVLINNKAEGSAPLSVVELARALARTLERRGPG
jgi:uncharacterized protein YecE (DUF72 family)